MQKHFFYILLFLMNTFINAQFQLVDSIEVNSTFSEVAMDEQSNLYLIENHQNLIKLKNNETMNQFSNRGFLSDLEVQSSLLITVISNQNQLLLLDSQLNPTQDPINLQTTNYTLSHVNVLDTNFLIAYDVFSHTIIQLNYPQNSIINSSPILTMLTIDEQIKNLFHTKNNIYLITNEHIYIFDEFLTFKKKHPFVTTKKIIQFGINLIYHTQNALYIWNLETQQSTKILEGDFTNFTANKSQLFVQTDKVAYIYKLIN